MPSMRFLPGDELAPNVMRELARRGVPEPSISERDAVICWGWRERQNDDAPADWSDVRVFDRHLVQRGSPGEDARIYRDAMCTTGSIEADWLGNSGRTCQGAFSRAIYDGSIPSERGYVDVLLQFAKVHECDWARFMLASLYASTIMDLNPDDLIQPAA